jgi:hypothetical protein
MQMHSEKLK